MSGRYHIKFAIACFANFLLSSPLIAQELVSGPLACNFSKEKGPMVTVQITNGDIDGAVLRMPRGYAISSGFKDGSERKGVLLRTYNTDFTAYPNNELLTSEGKSKSLAGIHDKLSILITNLVPMNEVALGRVYLNYGLRPDPSILKIRTKRLENGLLVLPYQSRIRHKDVFLNQDVDTYRDVISCSRDEDVPNPQCSHIFESGAYDIKISYSKTHLHRWQELRDGVSQLLQCFTIKQPIQRREN